MVPERPGLENEAASSTVLGRTPVLKGTAKASQTLKRVLHQKLATAGTDGSSQVLSVCLWLTANGCQEVSELWLSLGVKGKSQTCLSRRHLKQRSKAMLLVGLCQQLPASCSLQSTCTTRGLGGQMTWV